MSLDFVENYKAVRARLRNPPNAYKPPALPAPDTFRFVVKTRFKTAYRWPQQQRYRIEERPLPRPVRLTDIVDVVCDFYDIPQIEIRSHRRKQSLAYARHVAMYLSREMTTKSLPEIGRHFSGRDHTTILHAFRRIKRMVDDNTNNMRETIEDLQRRINAASVAAY